MYLTITDKCNMTCAHCCGSHGPRRGKHMDERTLRRALDLCIECGQAPYIGGGEPTVHPKFWQFLGIILSYAHAFDVDMLGMHTNGKRTNDALSLAELARRGVLGVTLSLDAYHEQIDQGVVNAFAAKERHACGYDLGRRGARDLRGTTDGADRQIVAIGRGRRIAGARKDYCVCADMQVDPDGRIWACGCRRTQFGTVFDPHIPDGAFGYECWERRQNDEDRETRLKEEALEVTGTAGDIRL